MRRPVRGKQPNSRMCLVCGLENSAGLHAHFYELDGGDLLARFTAGEAHQSYPGRLHGGLAAAMLDETIGRAVMVGNADVWGVTLELTTRFLKPLPLGQELRVLARLTKQTRRGFEGTGEVLLPDGTAAATGVGKYLKLPIEKIADFDVEAQQWRVVTRPDDPDEVEV